VDDQRHRATSTGRANFVAEHGLWDDRQLAAAQEVLRKLPGIDRVRVVYADLHGLPRSKTVSADSFRTVLDNGMDFSSGPFFLDTAHAIAVDLFADAKVGVPELHGAGDFIVVPDPLTFTVLPHTGGRIGWVIGDEYLRDGTPHPLSARGALRRLLGMAKQRGYEYVVGLEVEWYLTRYADRDRAPVIGGFGVQGAAPDVIPVDPGYQFNADWLCDALEPVLEPLFHTLVEMGLPVRTYEHESGPGQLEFTFDPLVGLAAADAMLLFRTVTKQVCSRRGFHASFMALPGIPGFDPSGWHLHQSLAAATTGANAFTSGAGTALLSEVGEHFVGGLLAHAAEASLLCVPTVNGYRRMNEQFVLSPDRVAWAAENRGAFIRVLGAPGDPVTHVENRIGEPCANPYLYLTAQLAAGLDGVRRSLPLPPAARDPHDTGMGRLPRDLGEALPAFAGSDLYREVLGAPLVNCLVALKRSELRRYEEWLAKNGPVDPGAVTAWEHDEYFTAF
jgi:glutamine synthetase